MDHMAILADYAEKMAPSQADKFLHLQNGTIANAIRRGEIRPYRFPDAKSKCYVTPMILAEWMTEFCRDKREAPAATGADGPDA